MAETSRDVNLIVGCGYLGKQLARKLLDAGQTVYGTTRSPANAYKLAELGVRSLLADVTQCLTLAALKPALEAERLNVFYMVPPGRPGNDPSPRQVVLDGMRNVLRSLVPTNLAKAVLVSSTSVYGQTNGESVTADTPAEPVDDRGQLLYEGEQQWLAFGEKYHVVRLAGLYGPGRIIGESAVKQGAPIVGNPNALLNLIHVEDAADLLIAVRDSEATGPIELGCDDEPSPRIAYYVYLAALLGVSIPPVLDDEEAAARLGLNVDRLRRVSSKRCDNMPTCERTGWRPKYPNYQDGVNAAMG